MKGHAGRKGVALAIGSLTATDLAWLAGYLEGEGSFMKGPPSNSGLPVVSFQTTDEDIAARVAAMFAVSYFSTAKARDYYKDAFRARLSGSRAVGLMKKLRPFMGVRRQAQIDTAIQSYAPAPPRGGNRKLTADQVREIRAATGTLREIGCRYGIHHSAICKIRKGRQYKDF